MPERAKTMGCVMCGRVKAWPDAFPSPHIDATCWECAWDRHIASAHPRTVRKIRREARKRARRIAERDVTAAMTERERRQTANPESA